jgi:ribosomal protein S12 methylthiotransferase
LRVAFVSLGCAKNLVNTEQMMALTQEAGHSVTGEADGADAAVVNTCGFIDAAKSEAIETILELAQLKKAGRLGKILVAGCLSQRYQDEIMKELPEVDGLLGTGSYTRVVPALEALAAGGTPIWFGNIDETEEDGARLLATPPYMAYLKIAEGCDNRCAYCVIPSLRGRYRSRAMESLLAEAEGLSRRGVKELLVVAQDITRYGADLYGKRRLAELLNELCKLDFHWIRLHYLYPDELDDGLIGAIASQPKILKYLDIPIQHVSDGILRAMNRRGTKAELTALFAKLREKIPGLVLRTSLICGLPGRGGGRVRGAVRVAPRGRHPARRYLPLLPRRGYPRRGHGKPGGRGRGGPACAAAHRASVTRHGRIQRKPAGTDRGGAVRGLRLRARLLGRPLLGRFPRRGRPCLFYRRGPARAGQFCPREAHRRVGRRPDRRMGGMNAEHRE